MSSLTSLEKRKLEQLFRMGSGYVPDFTDRTFSEFFLDEFRIDINAAKYDPRGSKAKKLRAFWTVEDDGLVGRVLEGLIKYVEALPLLRRDEHATLVPECRAIAQRLEVHGPVNEDLKGLAVSFDLTQLRKQIRRIEDAVDEDPDLAIGTAKDLVETCCRTILGEHGVVPSRGEDIQALTKATLKKLRLVPEDVPEEAKGREIVKRILSNLGTIGSGLAELRGLYGTGHGKDGREIGLRPRHARLAAGAANTLAMFLFLTHLEQRENEGER